MAIWAAVIGGGISLLGSALGGSDNSSQSGSNTPGYYDPYAAYRPAAANKLNALMLNPQQQLDQTPEYQSMFQAAQRMAASQGYNGSGNALVAAANAGGQAYQQAFNNLVTLSGAGQSPANAGMLAASQGNYNQQMNNQMWGGLGSIFGRAIGPSGANWFGGGGGGGSSGVIGPNEAGWG